MRMAPRCGLSGVDMRFGSLFAGIGGMDLGLERAGMRCAWQVEIDPYARRVLEKHWPSVRRHDDVRTFPPKGDWSVDLIAGGFPCQDISNAGKRMGMAGEQSGLWREFARIVRVLRPRYVLVENVAALLGRGMGEVLGDMAKSGRDVEWDCLPAAAFGAAHERDRVFLIAYPQPKRGVENVRHGFGFRPRSRELPRLLDCQVHSLEELEKRLGECSVLRSSDGIPNRVDRLECLGNAVVPQVAEWLGRRIMEYA
jgi:DNA (cytosine-5)-methyltransferase 1